MKYVVTVNGERLDVTTGEEGIRVGDIIARARLADVDGTPVKVLTIGTQVHRIVMQRGARRGEYALWIDGHRYEVEALDERTRAIRDLSTDGARSTGPAPLVATMREIVRSTWGRRRRSGGPHRRYGSDEMENELRARARPGQRGAGSGGAAVEKGAVLVELS